MADMATSITNTKTSLTLQFDENLQRLKASEAPSSSLICQNLKDLQNLHGYIDKMLQFPITKQALACRECCEKQVDELLEEGSLRLLDVSNAAKEALIQAKDSIKELQSAIRRRRRRGGEAIVAIEKFLSSRKKAKKEIQKTLANLKGHKKDVTLFYWSWTRVSTRESLTINPSDTAGPTAGSLITSLNKECDEFVFMIRNLKEAQVITLSLLQSLLSFMYGSLGQSKYINWSMVSKLMHPKRVACDCEESMSNTNEFEKLDVKLQSLLCQKTFSIVSIENFQNQLENLELSIEDLEEGIENLQRGLIRIRVSLLNILNH